MTRGAQARALVRMHRSGVLSTHSVKHPGYPYGSALPHVADHAGRPIVLISHLAEHTHNLEADPRASFIVCASGPDLQAQPRATLLGETRPVPDQDATAARYLRFYPDQAQYLQIGGFRFLALEPLQVRYIQGFGGLHWITGESYLATDTTAMAQAEPSVLEHMNADHRDALRDYCRVTHGFDPKDVEMIGVDCDGFDVRADGALLRFGFEEPVTAPAHLRAVFADLSRKRRGNA
jgi:heme oxygenase (biliverdin-IX-beta and delta-forming)